MTIAPESISAVTDRERFCAMLYTHPLMRCDATVVLCGEDGAIRTAAAVEVWKSGGSPGIVVSGKRHEPPAVIGAEAARLNLLSQGVAPDRILVESDAMNTREQALNVLDLAQDKGWTRLILVASHYHLPRAFLTFIQDLRCDEIRIVPFAVPARWSVAPEGTEIFRLALLDREYAKIDEYHAKGHVASYADGITYLSAWESK